MTVSYLDPRLSYQALLPPSEPTFASLAGNFCRSSCKITAIALIAFTGFIAHESSVFFSKSGFAPTPSPLTPHSVALVASRFFSRASDACLSCAEMGFPLPYQGAYPPPSLDPSLKTLEVVSHQEFCNYMLSLKKDYDKSVATPPQLHWSTEIPLGEAYGPARLFLGGLPHLGTDAEGRDFFSQMSSQNISSILSIVEPFERIPRTVPPMCYYQNDLAPITATMWKQKGVRQLILPSQDGYPVSFLNIRTGTWFIHEELSLGLSVYVHCKAGQGRSATVLLGFLMEYLGYPHDKAVDLLLDLRPNIGKHRPIERSAEYLAWLRAHPPLKSKFRGSHEALSTDF